MSCRKRKRYSKDIKCVFFPDDVKTCAKKEGKEPSLSSESSARCWQRCGDSFLDSPEMKSLKSSRRKMSAVRKLAQSPALGQTSAFEDPVHIAWSSSDSGQSDDETRKQNLSTYVAQQPRRLRRPTAAMQSYTRALHLLSTDKEDFPVIDTDSDLEESEEDDEDSGKQISDCESESFEEKPEDLPVKSSHVKDLEFPGYVSDGENIDEAATSSRLDSESFPVQTGEGNKRSVSDWVRSAQAMLQTPRKQSDKQAKTPEDSAKKKRKFKSEGLAERLNRLHCRQRSAISFWRHQSISDTSTTVDRPGVLVLEVLEVQEECNMQLAHCEQNGSPDTDHQCSERLSAARPRVLVLFNRDTAAQLILAPGDIIHIYPPWQSFSIEGFSCAIILNTHFSQKVHSASKLDHMSIPRALLPAERCVPYSLAKTFGLLDANRTTEEDKWLATSHAQCGLGALGATSGCCHSLLEAIEGLGQAGSVGRDVEVVVQRVYSIPVPDSSASILKPRVPSRSSSAPPVEKDKSRYCLNSS